MKNQQSLGYREGWRDVPEYTVILEYLPIRWIISVPVVLVLTILIYRIFFHPLRPVPGPLIARCTPLWIWYHSYIGDECSVVDALHQRYGPVVRVAPNEVSIADGAALAPIYTQKGGFLKASCYRNFDIDEHASIFSALDPTHRAQRAKAVVSMFSTTAIRTESDVIGACADRFVSRVQEESRTRKPVNVLNLTRSLAVDVVTAYLFGQSFKGLEEGGPQMSANEFINAFVAVGRFFYLPHWLFVLIEKMSEGFMPNKNVDRSMYKVEMFLRRLVYDAKEEDATYQARMIKAGIAKGEVSAQCKDLIFAGTDSTGMNLATLCWELAGHPEQYARLRGEILANQEKGADPQTLPYLSAVVKEGLRISMANPTRLPREVPPEGWSFGGYRFPAGTNVAVQLYTMHHNPAVFPEPSEFKPERWLNPTPEMQRDHIPFGLGNRQCIARNLANAELFMAMEGLVKSDALKGARRVNDRIEILQWFNAKVKGEKIELVWPDAVG